MPQEYQVVKAFQATVSREDKTPKSFVNKAGQQLFVWKVQINGVQGWIDVNKQAGNVINAGDTIFGTLEPNQWNTGYVFKGAQRPMNNVQAPQTGFSPQMVQSPIQRPQTPQTASTSVTIDDKLDAIIDMLLQLQQLLPSQGNQTVAAPTVQDSTEYQPTDDDMAIIDNLGL